VGDSPLLLTQTDARVTVTGPVAHAVVTQIWQNPNTRPVDGLYLFPLPQNAAVTDMQLTVGARWIRAEMRRREEARALFERARREGRVAGLLDQERPNIFAQEVANLAPGARVEVILSFDHEIACVDGACEYAFPTVVGPGFIPCRQADPGRIDPPVIAGGKSTSQILTLQADIDAGAPLRDLSSPSHRIRVTPLYGTCWRAVLESDDRVALDRDVVLRWRIRGAAPEIALLAWRDPRASDDPGVFTLLVQPKAAPRHDEVFQRELVFVLDCSGSMSGEPLQAAREVVRRALKSVRPDDTFQIIRFSESASGLGTELLQPTAVNVERALRYLDGLQGEGGTEMIAGIRAALGFPPDLRRLRIVAFLTDGYIGNETQILAEVRPPGGTRLFTFGIGAIAGQPAAAAVPSGEPSAKFLGSVHGLGYVGDGSRLDPAGAHRETQRPSPPAPLPPFDSLTLYRQDGSRIMVENDGEVWTESRRGRLLKRRLTAAELDSLCAALDSARPETWTDKGTVEKLLLDVPGRRFIVDLPSRDPAIRGLLDRMERWAS
jgi:Ca-activated chloride channel family protein